MRKPLVQLQAKLRKLGYEPVFDTSLAGHTKMTVVLKTGREITISLSTSPSNEHYMVDNVLQDVRRYERGIYK